MIDGIDVGTSQRNLDFGSAFSMGFKVCYVKLGGDNSGRYVAPYYVAEVDKARAVGMRIGHYWVPNSSQSATGAADYFVNNLRGWTTNDFAVLDNESLDGATLYDDNGAADWVSRVAERLGIPTDAVFVYIGAAEMRSRNWPRLTSLGVKIIVASYGSNNGSYSGAPNMGGKFNNVWAGHQYTSQGNIGGLIIDLNVFQDWAFNRQGETMDWNDSADILSGDGKFTATGAKTGYGNMIRYIEAYGKEQRARREEINARSETIHKETLDTLKTIATPNIVVDASAVAASLATNQTFLSAVAKAVNDDAHNRSAE